VSGPVALRSPHGGRSAAGQAAGYHFQVQRGLLSLIAGDDGTAVAMETLDDLVVEGDAGAVREFEQLKHSIRSGSLTERSRPLWKALDAWMDLVDHGTLDDVGKLILVATDRAPDGSAVALLRADARDVVSAERQLLGVATEDPGAQDTAKSEATTSDWAELARGCAVASAS
jgi:hypothetical protein